MPRTDPPGGSDGYDIAISRRVAPEVMRSAFALAKGEGAGKAGCPRHPQSCAQDAHGGPQVRRNTRLSLRDGFTAYAVISPEPNSSGLRRRRIGDRSKAPVGPDNLHQLDTSNGCQDHTVLPSAASSRHTLQPARMLPEEVSTEAFKRRSSARVARSRKNRPANTPRARRCRVHRNPSQRS
jgi:hypothetical protein